MKSNTLQLHNFYCGSILKQREIIELQFSGTTIFNINSSFFYGSECICLLLLIEQHIPAILYKDTLPLHPVQGLPEWSAVHIVEFPQPFSKIWGSPDPIIKWNVGEDVVCDVGVVDMMKGRVEEPSIVPVHCCQNPFDIAPALRW